MNSRLLTGSRLAVVASVVAASLCVACSPHETTPSASTTAAATPPPFDGLYLQIVEGPNSTYNGAPKPAPPLTQWWAFRSACSPTGCVATSTKLDDRNTNIAEMPVTQRVYRFTDGAWEWTHDEVLSCVTAAGSPVPGSTKARYVTRLVPQPDGLLSGKSTSVALDDGCGDKGAVVQTPTTYTRKGEVPADVPMIDPTTVG